MQYETWSKAYEAAHKIEIPKEWMTLEEVSRLMNRPATSHTYHLVTARVKEGWLLKHKLGRKIYYSLKVPHESK